MSARIQKELFNLWEYVSAHTNLQSVYDPDLGKLLDKFSHEAEEIALIHLQPWFAILEQAIGWLVALHFILSEKNQPITEDLRVPWVLTGAACTQAIAIRKLCMCGLDLPARAVLRTLIETLAVCTITTFDKDLRKHFRDAEDFEQAKVVWKQHFTTEKIHTKFAEIFKIQGFEADLINDFKLWQQEETIAASQAVHPSYIACACATSPYPADKRTITPGALGSATLFSVRTLAQASRTIWYYSMVGFNLLIKPSSDGGPPLFEFPKDDMTKSIIVNGHFVLDQIVRKYWIEDGSSEEEDVQTQSV